MNPAAPYEENNWQNLAEPGEMPAIRATAFEDFHSLAVNSTKRLVSTTLYCAMSRLRARDSIKIKHADVSPGDVEAAVNILGLKANSNKFWTSAARRCYLNVVNIELEAEADEDEDEDDEEEEEENQNMTYDEIEAALGSETSLQLRSTSSQALSRLSSRASAHSGLGPSSSSSLDDLEFSSSDSSIADYPNSAAENSDSGRSFSSSSSTHFRFSARRLEAKLKKKAARKAVEKSEDAYTEAFDMEAGRLEEERLWALLKQDPPFELEKAELSENLAKGKSKRGRGEGNWKEWVEYWSPWETMERPVLEEEFANNRVLRAAKRRRIGDAYESAETSEDPVANGSEELPDEEGETAGEGVQSVQQTIEVEDVEVDSAASDSRHTSPQQYEDNDEVEIR